MKLFSYIFINFEICYPKVINKEMWARVLPCVNVCVFLHKCSLFYAHLFQLCSYCRFSSFFLRSLTHSLVGSIIAHNIFSCSFFSLLSFRTYIHVLFIYEKKKQSKFILCIFFSFLFQFHDSVSRFARYLIKSHFFKKKWRGREREALACIWSVARIIILFCWGFHKNMPRSPTAFHFSTLRWYTHRMVCHTERRSHCKGDRDLCIILYANDN